MEKDRIKDDASVASSSPGGGNGGEVCRLRLYLVEREVNRSDVISEPSCSDKIILILDHVTEREQRYR